MADVELTRYGFRFGPVIVERACSDRAKGWVVLMLKTAKDDLQIYITKTGKVRVFSQKRGELK